MRLIRLTTPAGDPVYIHPNSVKGAERGMSPNTTFLIYEPMRRAGVVVQGDVDAVVLLLNTQPTLVREEVEKALRCEWKRTWEIADFEGKALRLQLLSIADALHVPRTQLELAQDGGTR